MDDGESVLSLISSKLNYVGPGDGQRGERGINQKLAPAEYNETLSEATHLAGWDSAWFTAKKIRVEQKMR